MDGILEYSSQFLQLSESPLFKDTGPAFEATNAQSTTSRPKAQSNGSLPSTSGGRSAEELRARIQDLDNEVRGCHADIETIQQRVRDCLAEKRKLGNLLEQTSANRLNTTTKTVMQSKGKNVNYLTQSFDWTDGLRARMKSVFGIKEFRLCQEGLVHTISTR